MKQRERHRFPTAFGTCSTLFLAGIRGRSRVAETALYLPLPRTRDVPRSGSKVSAVDEEEKGSNAKQVARDTRQSPMLFQSRRS